MIDKTPISVLRNFGKGGGWRISVLFHFTNAGSMARAAESMSVSSGEDGAEVRVAKLKRTNWVCYGLPCSCT